MKLVVALTPVPTKTRHTSSVLGEIQTKAAVGTNSKPGLDLDGRLDDAAEHRRAVRARRALAV